MGASCTIQGFYGNIYQVGNLGFVYTIDPSGGGNERFPFPRLYFPLRMAVLDMDSTVGGTTIIVR